MSVIIETSIGDLEVDLYVSKAPKLSRNFLKLCKAKHYNNALFAEVQKQYLTQIRTSSPTTIDAKLLGKDKETLQSRWIQDEFDVTLKHRKFGLLSTNNCGPDKNDSEFFITLSDSPLTHFDDKHSIFGIVQVGSDVLEKFNSEVIVDESNHPYFNIRILHTIVIEDPFDDPENFEEPDASPPRIETSDNNRLEYHERERILQETEQNEEEALELAKQQISKVREIKLQILGDIPDADMKPPENVLFVCQLNEITQERDLELIFSRFGVITRCEVVRDWKTGESLQYAFIEFETEKSCQEAYFKMKGALIDERRIHVDFSQSLQKFKPFNRNKAGQNKKPATGFDQLEYSKFYRNRENPNSNRHRMVFDQEQSNQQTSNKNHQNPENRRKRSDSREAKKSERNRDEVEQKKKPEERNKDSKHHSSNKSNRDDKSERRKHSRSRSKHSRSPQKREKERTETERRRRSNSRSKHSRSKSNHRGKERDDRKHSDRRNKSRSHSEKRASKRSEKDNTRERDRDRGNDRDRDRDRHHHDRREREHRKDDHSSKTSSHR